jgi:hypothetical protein
MTITLSIPDLLDKCQACKAKPTKEKFCDLTLVEVGRVEFPICHDCALKLINDLVNRYYAIWGLSLVHEGIDGHGQPGVLMTILEEVQAIRSRLEGEDTPDQDLPPSVEDALVNLGKGHS